MASANVELVRSIVDAWGRGDFSSAEWAHSEIEFVRADGPSPGHWTGLRGLADGTRDWLSAWKDAREFAEEYRELDGERVLVLFRFSGQGRTSGLELGEMHAEGAHLFHVRDGKVTRFVHYLDREHAFADLGLAPTAGAGDQSMSQDNVEVVGRIYEAMGEGDFDRMLTYWDARGDYYPVQKFPEAQPCHGAEEIRRFFVEFGLGVELIEFRIDAVAPVGDDRVLVRLRLSYEGKASGLKVGGELFHCYWLRHGRVFRQEDHLTLPGALFALGLEGETLEAAGLRE